MLLSKNISLLSFLYFIQGLPYGLQSKFLPIYLRTHGMSLTNVGLFKLLLVPWMCKALWSPFVDRIGTKKDWLLGSLLALVFICFLGSYLDPKENIKLGILMLMLNIATSTQDIAVDGLAIGILSCTELAQGNIAQVVGYKFGAIIGGGVFLWLSSYITWKMLFLCLTSVYTVGIFIVHFQINTESSNTSTIEHEVKLPDKQKANPTQKEYPGRPDATHQPGSGLKNLIRKHLADIFSTEGTIWICVYVLVYKLGEVSALNMLPLFLVDHDISSSVVGFWTGVAGQVFSIGGSVVGGWLISYYSYTTVQVAHCFCSVRVVLIAIQLLIVIGWSTFFIPSSALLILAVSSMSGLLFVSGLVTTATFTMMMQCSQRAPSSVQASHYTTLATLEVMGKLLFSVITGTIADLFGYQFIFILFTILAILVLPLFKFCPNIVKQTIAKNH